MAIKLTGAVTSINGYPVRPGMYEELHLPSDEQLQEELGKLRWTTPEQDLLNAERRTLEVECHRCHGRGYTRKDKNTGCRTCRGSGWVVNS